MKTIVVVSGVTSSLFASLIPFFRFSAKKIIGFVRPTEDKDKIAHRKYLESAGVRLISTTSGDPVIYCSQFNRENARFLWLSTHDDAQQLAKFAAIAPTLAIGSGAMLDFYMGRTDLTKLPEQGLSYIQGKVRMALTEGVTTLLPGFYLEDDPSVPVTPSGLHRETTAKIVAPEFDVNYSWDKPKYVTPKSFLAEMIVRWCANPEPYLNHWYHCGTDRAYNRWEVRVLCGQDVPTEVKEQHLIQAPVYLKEAQRTVSAFGVKCDDENIAEACRALKIWAKKHKL